MGLVHRAYTLADRFSDLHSIDPFPCGSVLNENHIISYDCRLSGQGRTDDSSLSPCDVSSFLAKCGVTLGWYNLHHWFLMIKVAN